MQNKDYTKHKEKPTVFVGFSYFSPFFPFFRQAAFDKIITILSDYTKTNYAKRLLETLEPEIDYNKIVKFIAKTTHIPLYVVVLVL